MCIALLLFDTHPSLQLLLAFNRDEFWERPTQAAHFWPDQPDLLGGRDALRKGTWLGITRAGRFALLTNFREPMTNGSGPAAVAAACEPGNQQQQQQQQQQAPLPPAGAATFVQTTTAPSRGALTTDFLAGSMAPLEYLRSLAVDGFFGFNLLVGDLAARQLAYYSNRDPEGPRLLAPGAYGVSNGLLQQWPKVHKGLAALGEVLSSRTLPCEQAGAAGTAAAVNDTPAQQARSSTSTSTSSDRAPPDAEDADAEPASCCCHHGSPQQAAQQLPWAQGQQQQQQQQQQQLPWAALFRRGIGDPAPVPDSEPVPLTGVGEDLDRRLSAIFIQPFEMQPGVLYGTRSQTLIAAWRDGLVEQRERYVVRADDGGGSSSGGGGTDAGWEWREVQHSFTMAGAEQQAE